MSINEMSIDFRNYQWVYFWNLTIFTISQYTGFLEQIIAELGLDILQEVCFSNIQPLTGKLKYSNVCTNKSK